MPAIEMLSNLLKVNPSTISKAEIIFLEADLFIRICEELNDLFKSQYKNYHRIVKIDTNLEGEMLNANLIKCLINDILATGEYDISGIAQYSGLPVDVIYDLALGCNKDPSLTSSRKILELHRSVRPLLYRDIIKKITSEYMAA